VTFLPSFSSILFFPGLQLRVAFSVYSLGVVTLHNTRFSSVFLLVFFDAICTPSHDVPSRDEDELPSRAFEQAGALLHAWSIFPSLRHLALFPLIVIYFTSF